jgi:hypothetical protein
MVFFNSLILDFLHTRIKGGERGFIRHCYLYPGGNLDTSIEARHIIIDDILGMMLNL